MTLAPFMFDIAVRACGEKLLLPVLISRDETAQVIEHKPEILAKLRTRQMTPAGFYTSLPLGLLEAIKAVPWLIADAETSARTRYSVAQRITKSTKIGNGTWGSYLAQHQDATLNVAPRLRVLTIHHPLIGTYAWDMDALPLGSEQRRRLLDAVIRDKILIGHNIGFDLSWLFSESEARPRFCLDTLMLVRQVKPDILNQLFRNAATGTKEQKKIAVEMIQRTGSQVKASLAYVAACLELEVPDKTYQKPANWAVTPLSRQHFDYVAGDVSMPLQILHRLFPGPRLRRFRRSLSGGIAGIFPLRKQPSGWPRPM